MGRAGKTPAWAKQCWVGLPGMGGIAKAEVRLHSDPDTPAHGGQVSPWRSLAATCDPRTPNPHPGPRKGWLDPRAASAAEAAWSCPHSRRSEAAPHAPTAPRPPAGPGAYGLPSVRRVPPAAGEAQAAGRAPQQVPHSLGRSHGTVVPPQGAIGLLPALAARQVPVGPVRGWEGLGQALRQNPKLVPTALGFSFGLGLGGLCSSPHSFSE